MTQVCNHNINQQPHIELPLTILHHPRNCCYVAMLHNIMHCPQYSTLLAISYLLPYVTFPALRSTIRNK